MIFQTTGPPISSSVKCYPIRLTPGQEIKSSLIGFVKETKLKSAFVMTCVGSVTKATLRFAEKSPKKVSTVALIN